MPYIARKGIGLLRFPMGRPGAPVPGLWETDIINKFILGWPQAVAAQQRAPRNLRFVLDVMGRCLHGQGVRPLTAPQYTPPLHGRVNCIPRVLRPGLAPSSNRTWPLGVYPTWDANMLWEAYHEPARSSWDTGTVPPLGDEGSHGSPSPTAT